MKIEVLYFAQLKDTFGTDSEVLEVTDGVTTAEVLEQLRERHNWAGAEGVPLTFAVNECVVDDTHRLQDGDRLALLTPVSGG
jgi:molybdopterin synthase sulfur carrier subunit